VAPPQSTSLSPPFCTASPHVGAWQIWFEHTWLAQSLATPHFLPGAQPGHAAPQSVSLSLPFFTWSVPSPYGTCRSCTRSSAVRRSEAHAPVCARRHRATAVGVGLGAVFHAVPHCADTHRPCVQIVDAQSEARAAHAAVAHGGHVAPPQSMSVSVAFAT